MDQQLRALVALSEDLSLIPSTYVTAHNSGNFSCRDLGYSPGFLRHCMHTEHITSCKHTRVHKVNKQTKPSLKRESARA